MLGARLVAYVTGTVNQELLLRNEYLAAENRIVRSQIKGWPLLSEREKVTLAEIAHRLGRKALKDVARDCSAANDSVAFALFGF
jgi:putative transposase